MSRLIFFFVAILLGWSCLATPIQSQGLFDEEGPTERERASASQGIKAGLSILKALEAMELLLTYGEFQKGNCSGLGEIDTKAKEGIAKYQFILADLYHKGLCVTKNDERAVDWLKKSAKQGYARAQHDLGVYYKSGLGIPANPRQAAYWFLKAAENGVAASQHMYHHHSTSVAGAA